MNKSFPWNLDAFRHFDGTQTEDYLLVNKPIKEFLERDDKFFLIGAKGLGCAGRSGNEFGTKSSNVSVPSGQKEKTLPRHIGLA